MLTAELAADLYVLTAALDEPGTDVSWTLRRLVTDAAAMIPTFLGLSVVANEEDSRFSFTVLNDDASFDDVHSSIGFVMPGPDQPTLRFILYAAVPGAFVDMAADLAWLTDRRTTDFTLDADVDGAGDPGFPLVAQSMIDQAIGVLIDRGHTPAQADRVFGARMTATGTDRQSVARLILSTVATPTGPLGQPNGVAP